MMGEDEEETLQQFGFRKTSIDKLTYKNIIADAINQCRRSRSHIRLFQKSVEGLEEIISFDVPGYPLDKSLKQIKKTLEIERKKQVRKKQDELGKKIFQRATQAKLRIWLHQWYWDEYFKKIIQLLAENNLLLETQKYIPIREKKRVYESDEVLHA